MIYKNILIAVDFSDATALVVARAAALATENSASLTLLHVVEYMPPLDFAGDPLSLSVIDVNDPMLQESAKQSLQTFVDDNLSGIDVKQVITVGLAKYEILRELEENNHDLLVIGSHGRHGLSRLLGSTAAAVLNDSPCDVLAVRLTED